MGRTTHTSRLVDTDVIVDAFNGWPAAVEYLVRIRQVDNVGISVVTVMELIEGAHDKRELVSVLRKLKPFLVYPIEAHTSRLASNLIERYHLAHSLMIPDALIAATALSLGATLVSRNGCHYKPIRGLKLELPY